MEEFNEELAVKRVVEIILNSYENSKNLINLNVSKKERNDIVTDVDLFMENSIISELSKYYPTHSFNAEESGETIKENGGDFYEWVIDPIDGTINFAAGLPDFGIVVALQKNGKTILGVNVFPKLGEVYTAIKGQGAYCNGERLHVSNNKNLNDSVIFVYLGAKHNEEDTHKTIKLIEDLNPKVRGIRIVGSSACVSSWVASGKIDAIINLKSTQSLGSTAGRLFITEAGGTVTNALGKVRQKKDTMVCSNGNIQNELIKLIANSLQNTKKWRVW